jgi:hypothetical protein
MRAVLILVCVAAAVAGIFVFVRLQGSGEFSEFYREQYMQRTPKLEEHPEVQKALAEMKQAGLCGLMYNVRTTKMTDDAKRGYDCATEQWIDLNDYRLGAARLEGVKYGEFSPYGIHKFAVLPRDGQLIVVTEGTRGQNTFDELTAGIPKVTRVAITAFAAAQARRAEQKVEDEKQRVKGQKRQDEVKNSFSN